MQSLHPSFVEGFCSVCLSNGLSEKAATDLLVIAREKDKFSNPDFSEGFRETVKQAKWGRLGKTLAGLGIVGGTTGAVAYNHLTADRSNDADWTISKEDKTPAPDYNPYYDSGVIAQRNYKPDTNAPSTEYQQQVRRLREGREAAKAEMERAKSRLSKGSWLDRAGAHLSYGWKSVNPRRMDASSYDDKIKNLGDDAMDDRSNAYDSIQRNIHGGLLRNLASKTTGGLLFRPMQKEYQDLHRLTRKQDTGQALSWRDQLELLRHGGSFSHAQSAQARLQRKINELKHKADRLATEPLE